MKNILIQFINYISRHNSHKPTTQAKKQYVEMYTCNNKSYFKALDIPTNNKHPLGMYSDMIDVSSMCVREFPAGLKFDYHVAPNKQYILYIDGQVEVETSSGEKKVFSAGDILLANDLTGKGHITRTLSAGKSIIIKA